jgi:hypothetical protein
MYKFNGTAFNKLPYTVPFSGDKVQLSVNNYGNFIAQANATDIVVYRISDTASLSI